VRVLQQPGQSEQPQTFKLLSRDEHCGPDDRMHTVDKPNPRQRVRATCRLFRRIESDFSIACVGSSKVPVRTIRAVVPTT
jgi:hypothetical protein